MCFKCGLHGHCARECPTSRSCPSVVQNPRQTPRHYKTGCEWRTDLVHVVYRRTHAFAFVVGRWLSIGPCCPPPGLHVAPLCRILHQVHTLSHRVPPLDGCAPMAGAVACSHCACSTRPHSTNSGSALCCICEHPMGSATCKLGFLPPYQMTPCPQARRKALPMRGPRTRVWSMPAPWTGST